MKMKVLKNRRRTLKRFNPFRRLRKVYKRDMKRHKMMNVPKKVQGHKEPKNRIA